MRFDDPFALLKLFQCGFVYDLVRAPTFFDLAFYLSVSYFRLIFQLVSVPLTEQDCVAGLLRQLSVRRLERGDEGYKCTF